MIEYPIYLEVIGDGDVVRYRPEIVAWLSRCDVGDGRLLAPGDLWHYEGDGLVGLHFFSDVIFSGDAVLTDLSADYPDLVFDLDQCMSDCRLQYQGGDWLRRGDSYVLKQVRRCFDLFAVENDFYRFHELDLAAWEPGKGPLFYNNVVKLAGGRYRADELRHALSLSHLARTTIMTCYGPSRHAQCGDRDCLLTFDSPVSCEEVMAKVSPLFRGLGLQNDDVEELTSRLLTKLVEAIPRFDYDPHKGSFRGWLKTITHREVTNLARERRRRLPGDEATGKSAVYDLLLEHADEVDDLVAGLHDQSEGMLRSVRDALKEVQAACQGEEQKSWELFQRIFLGDQAIEPVAAEIGLSYHAAAMRVQRIKKKVRNRALQLALQRGLTL